MELFAAKMFEQIAMHRFHSNGMGRMDWQCIRVFGLVHLCFFCCFINDKVLETRQLHTQRRKENTSLSCCQPIRYDPSNWDITTVNCVRSFSLLFLCIPSYMIPSHRNSFLAYFLVHPDNRCKSVSVWMNMKYNAFGIWPKKKKKKKKETLKFCMECGLRWKRGANGKEKQSIKKRTRQCRTSAENAKTILSHQNLIKSKRNCVRRGTKRHGRSRKFAKRPKIGAEAEANDTLTQDDKI